MNWKSQPAFLCVAPRGAALKAGIHQGDVILAVNETTIERVADFNRLIAKLPTSSTLALLVLRNGVRLYVPLRLS